MTSTARTSLTPTASAPGVSKASLVAAYCLTTKPGAKSLAMLSRMHSNLGPSLSPSSELLLNGKVSKSSLAIFSSSDLVACSASYFRAANQADTKTGYMDQYAKRSQDDIEALSKVMPPTFLGVEQSTEVLNWIWDNFSAVAGDQPSFECWRECPPPSFLRTHALNCPNVPCAWLIYPQRHPNHTCSMRYF